MKIELGKIVDKEKVSKAVCGTKELGLKVVSGAKDGIVSVAEKTKNESYLRRLKKYNPIFPDDYTNPDFNIPNMIMIVDDAVRKGIDVCEGAIGWLGNNAGMETLYLYDEAVDFSGLNFVPTVTCDAVYYVDSFDKNRFVRTDCIFSKAHEERMAELKNIAYMLGAKKCVIEIEESDAEMQSMGKKFSTSEKTSNASVQESFEQSNSRKGANSRSGRIEIEFEGSDEPQMPVLKWFQHDDNVNRLIEMRCNNANSIKKESLVLLGASSATMSQKTACAIDGAVSKIGTVSNEVSMDSQAKKEHHSKLMYEIEF